MLVETPEKPGFLLLPGFDNAFPGCRFVALVGGLVGGLFMPDSVGQTNHFWEKIDEGEDSFPHSLDEANAAHFHS
jgi:hypothetical protein